MRRSSRPLRALACTLTLLACAIGAARAEPTQFPRPPELEPDVKFWQRVYSQVTTQEGLLHDENRLDVVYEQIEFAPGLTPREREAQVNEARSTYQRILRHLAGEPTTLSGEERRVRELWPADVDPRTLREAADNIRFQLGQADRFREGLIRAGAYEDRVRETLVHQGLPEELAALPHVESSFNPLAYSKVGAAGMWQFMPGTGRRWLRIDRVIDERLDPYKSTLAATQYLALNYELLGTWPLALTAYNHGAGGVRRARDLMGTSDIVTIVRAYQSGTFGFASRNFYVSFLAALELDHDYAQYFGPLTRLPPDASRTVRVPDYVPMAALARVFATDSDTLRDLNHALLDPVWRGDRFVPRDYLLRIPAGARDPTQLIEGIPDSERFVNQRYGPVYRLRRGESVSHAADTLGVPLATLLSANGLASAAARPNGGVLKVPDPATVRAEPPAAAPAPASTEGPYVVRAGDSLSSIAHSTGVPETTLMVANGIKDPNYLFEGQRLKLSAEELPVVTVEANPEPPAVIAGPPARVERDQASAVEPGLVPGTQTAASADPIDYSVSDGTTRVQGEETLGQIAEWLEVSAARLRDLNAMHRDTVLTVGRRIRLDLHRVSAETFEERRIAWHKQQQDEFFSRFRITGQERHRLKSGESLWTLTQQYGVPIWLLRQYNPDVDFSSVRRGAEVIVPHVQSVASAPAGTG
jgi:membrane-bound lytic murein transglycosylase D